MQKDVVTKLEYLRNNKPSDGPISGHCMVYGEWSTTVLEFLDTLICNKKTYNKMPKWHEDFMVIPVINALYDQVEKKNIT